MAGCYVAPLLAPARAAAREVPAERRGRFAPIGVGLGRSRERGEGEGGGGGSPWGGGIPDAKAVGDPGKLTSHRSLLALLLGFAQLTF
jgi:hypothetical protein